MTHDNKLIMDQKTNMPDKEDQKNVYQLPLRVLPQQNIKVRWASDVDFLKNIVLNYNTSEYGAIRQEIMMMKAIVSSQ